MTVELKQRRGNIYIEHSGDDGKAKEIRLIGVLFHVHVYRSENEDGSPIVWSEITVADTEIKVA